MQLLRLGLWGGDVEFSGHGRHSVLPRRSENESTLHTSHVLCPTRGLYVPGEHKTQLSLLIAPVKLLKEPTGQAVHTVEPSLSE